MLGVIDYNYINLQKFQEYLEEVESYTYDFELLEWLKEGLDPSRTDIKLAENNQQSLMFAQAQLTELEAPLIEAINSLNEVKKKNLERLIEYQNFFIERSLD